MNKILRYKLINLYRAFIFYTFNIKELTFYYSGHYHPIIIGALFFIYLRSSIKSNYYKHVTNAIKESGEGKILTLANLHFSESGILEKTNSSEVKYNWSAIIKKTEVHNCYYLYTTSLHALIMPKRVFVTIDEKERFERTLLQYIPLQVAFKNIV